MTAAGLIAEARAAGVRLTPRLGEIRLSSDRQPSPELLDKLREHRDDVYVQLELQAALWRISRPYSRLPDPKPPVTGPEWKAIDTALDRAISAGDRTQALEAIARWERRARELLGLPPDVTHAGDVVLDFTGGTDV